MSFDSDMGNNQVLKKIHAQKEIERLMLGISVMDKSSCKCMDKRTDNGRGHNKGSYIQEMVVDRTTGQQMD